MSDTVSLKLRTWWHRDELDEQLAHGADPAADAGLARRAAQLRAPSTRLTLAAALENAVREAHKPWSVSARLPLARVEVRACTDDLLALARRLRGDGSVDLPGLAMVARLVCDGTSSLYGEASVSLRFAVRSARLALEPVELLQPELTGVA
jgi:hypothetical protein